MDRSVDTDLPIDQTDVQPDSNALVVQMRTEITYLREMLDRKNTQIDQQNQLIAMTSQQNGQLLNQFPPPRRLMGGVGGAMDCEAERDTQRPIGACYALNYLRVSQSSSYSRVSYSSWEFRLKKCASSEVLSPDLMLPKPVKNACPVSTIKFPFFT